MMLSAMTHATRMPILALLAWSTMGVASAQDVELDVPYVPTPMDVVDKMLDLVSVKEGDVVIDLGSGDGRIAIAAAKKGARAYGVDIDPVRVREANENAKKEGVTDRVTFREQDLFDTNISDADVITMYLLPSVNRDLRPRILDLEPGTRIVSHAFDMGEWEADERANVGGRQVYYWKVPARVDGRWTFRMGDNTVPVTLTQRFQNIQGSATIDGRTAPVTGKVDGDMLRLALETGDGRREFHGRVDGQALEPVAADGAQSWSATRG